LENYDIVLFLGVYHHLSRKSRKSILLNLLKLSKKFFAIRTPKESYIKDSIDKIIIESGFREIRLSKKKNKNGMNAIKLGLLKIYRKEI
jgi:hypothetical protein